MLFQKFIQKRKEEKEKYKLFKVTMREWDEEEIYIKILDARELFWLELYQDCEVLDYEEA